MTAQDAPELARRIAAVLRSNTPEAHAADTTEWRQSFGRLHFIHD
jgi:glycine hydroxymethyltransferase